MSDEAVDNAQLSVGSKLKVCLKFQVSSTLYLESFVVQQCSSKSYSQANLAIKKRAIFGPGLLKNLLPAPNSPN